MSQSKPPQLVKLAVEKTPQQFECCDQNRAFAKLGDRHRLAVDPFDETRMAQMVEPRIVDDKYIIVDAFFSRFVSRSIRPVDRCRRNKKAA